MEQAEKLCDHICMISRGRKVLDGSMAEVKRRFGKNSIQVGFEGDAGFVKSLPGVKDAQEFPNHVELDLEDGTEPNELLTAIAARVRVRRFEVMEPSLYNIFLDMAKVDPSELEGGRHV